MKRTQIRALSWRHHLPIHIESGPAAGSWPNGHVEIERQRRAASAIPGHLHPLGLMDQEMSSAVAVMAKVATLTS